tara:strand:- start:1054 stop:2073 length:1020 start_codon:yes stop_codon:yes gene_type:complete
MVNILLTNGLLIFILTLVIRHHKKIFLNDENQIQNIHLGSVSRLGGCCIYIMAVLNSILNQDFVFFKIMIFCLLALLPAIMEDLSIKVRPIIRLFFITLSCITIVSSVEKLPILNFPLFFEFSNHYFFSLLFFSLCLAILVNGQNMIDGSNGLSAISAATTFGCLAYIGIIMDDVSLTYISLTFISLVFSFLLFNYPFGKIFLGDTGSYFLGFITGYLVIKTYGKYEDLPTWSAAVILFYPSLEVIFSYIRKIIQGKSPFIADNEHLHIKIFYLLQSGSKVSVLYNALVAPFLAIIWITPLVAIPFLISFPKTSFLSMVIVVITYLFFYYSIPSPNKKH